MALGYDFGQPVMMQLGSYQFGIATAAYQQLQRSTAWRWPTQERFGQLPAPQYTGPADDTMTLPGVLYPEWRGGFGQLDQMRAIAGAGLPLPLVDGSGASLGDWAIEAIDETQGVFASEGRPRRVEFSIRLRRFPDAIESGSLDFGGFDLAAPSLIGAIIPAGAIGPVDQVQGLAGSVASSAKSLSSTLSRAADQVQSVVAPVTTAAQSALGGVLRAVSVVDELQSTANRAMAMVGAKPLDVVALVGAGNLAAKAAGLITAAESSSALLRNSSQTLAALSNVPPAATRVMREATVAAQQTVSLVRSTAAQAATIKGE